MPNPVAVVDHYELTILTTQRKRRLFRMDANVHDVFALSKTSIEWVGRYLVDKVKLTQVFTDGKRKTLYTNRHFFNQ